MKNIGIIAEFNPFHKGHEYFISEAKKASGADNIVIIMSGDFVQRGEPAIWDKYIRTQAALLGGADLVLELPVAFSASSAAVFADGAVTLLDKLGVIDELWFGSENADPELFDMISEILVNEPFLYSESIKNHLKTGVSYPKARNLAIVESFKTDIYSEKEINNFMNSPNNILGLEYYSAIKRLNSRIKPKTLLRKGGGYNDQTLDPVFSSASAIRKAISSSSVIKNELPEFFTDKFVMDILIKKVVYADDFSQILRYKIMSESADSLCGYLDINEDLARRIKQKENEFIGFSQFAKLLKSKNRTLTNINRCLLHILLSLTDRDVENAFASDYIRVLGINKNSDLLHEIKDKSKIQLCTKPSDLKDDSYEKDLFASNIYESICSDKSGMQFRHEYTRPIKIIS